VATLTEAGREMEAVEFERKQLATQLHSALQNVDTAMRELEEAELGLDSEMRGLGRSGRAAQEQNEKLAQLLGKNEHDMQHMQTQMTQIHTDRQRLAEQYAMLRKSLDHTTGETQKVKLRLKEAEQELSGVEQTIQKVARDTMALQEKIEEQMSQQSTVKRSEANTNKSTKKLSELVQDQDMEMQNLQNEISRVKVDALNTKAHNQMLKERLETLSADLTDREKLIDQYEMEIRKRHNQIEKKQLYVDRLNREYDEKRSKQDDGGWDGNPLEGKIKQLKKQLAEKSQECQDMQKSWIGKQTDLLALQEEIDGAQDHVQDQKNRKLILTQKRIRTEAGWDGQKKEINELRLDVKHLQHEMDNLNSMAATNLKRHDELQNTTQTMETEFVRKLKEIEENCIGMEGEINILKDERGAMMEEIVESERQVMLWERKIHLEKEMQEALDPSVGQAETTAMKKEIHRMELRYEQLKRRQDQMIQEMERVIHKRDTIQLKYEPKASSDPNAGMQVKRQVASLRSNLSLCTQAAQETEQRTAMKEEEARDVQQQLEQATLETTELERSVEEAMLEAALQEVKKARLAGDLSRAAREAQRLEEVAADGTGIPAARAPALRVQVTEVQGLRKRVEDALNEVSDSFGGLDPLFSAFKEWHASTAPLVEAA